VTCDQRGDDAAAVLEQQRTPEALVLLKDGIHLPGGAQYITVCYGMVWPDALWVYIVAGAAAHVLVGEDRRRADRNACGGEGASLRHVGFWG
jgi:hypothetical protein